MHLGKATRGRSAAQIDASAQVEAVPSLGLQPSGAAIRATGIGAEDLMHATAHRRPFTAAGWTFEMKLDGLRVLSRRVNDREHLLSRRGRSLAPAFPELAELLGQIPDEWVLDGAIVLPDVPGQTDTEALRRRAIFKLRSMLSAAPDNQARLCLFDMLFKDGHDLRSLPLSERQVWLSALAMPRPGLQIVSSLESRGHALFDQAVAMDLEGIVAKRLDSPYRAGRQETWLKIKNPAYSRREPLGWFRSG